MLQKKWEDYLELMLNLFQKNKIKQIKKKKKKKKKKKEEVDDIFGPNIEKNRLDLEIEGENLTRESNDYMIGNSIKATTETGVYVGSGFSLVNGVGRIATGATAESLALGLRFTGLGLTIFGIGIGVGLGGYFTSKYCEDLLSF